MYRQLMQPTDSEIVWKLFNVLLQFKINYKCICVYYCVAILRHSNLPKELCEYYNLSQVMYHKSVGIQM
jgi:hypothetical protein